MARYYTFLFVIVMAFSTFTAEAMKPKWVRKRPSERDYYIGIGMAEKNDFDGLNYAKKARADALQELASEIEINISSNSLLKQFENNYEFRQTYESEINTSVKENVSGYNVQTWENKNEYWVMMRLDKEEYQRRKSLALKKAKQKAASHFRDAREYLQDQRITPALASYFKSIEALENHVQEDLTHQSVDGKIDFSTDIMKELREVFSRISLSPTNPNYHISFSQNMETPFQARAEYYTPEGKKVPVKNFPVQFHFTEGDGILTEKSNTNAEGLASSYIQKLQSSLKKQRVEVTFDQTAMLKEENIKSPLISFFLPDEAIPSAVFNIELQKSDAWFEASEVIYDQKSSREPFASQLKSKLNETYFNFTDGRQKAEYIVKTDVEFSKGEVKEGNGYSVYLVFADLYFSVVHAESGTEIFNDTVTEVKGMRAGNYNSALKEARLKLLDRFRQEIYPQLEKLNF
ncbi:MAG: LPP20 family lipoprotein [Marinilabiliaceae bacterium]